MKATETPLNSFLSQTKTQFIIPVYQRNYDWKEEHCRQLFSDILEVGSNPGNTHFIGSIVFIHEGVYTTAEVKQLVVIDGQQRLTTFSLLYLALHKFALANNMEEKANEIHETYLINKYVKEESSKLKLKQSDINAKALKFLSSNNNPEDYPDYSNVINNYNFFRDNISRDNFEILHNGLNALLFVEISLERGKDDPQRIFESLNSTGLELSQADLIRNYILMGLNPGEQIRIFENYWERIEENAKVIEKDESRVSDFIRDYLTYKNKKIPNKNKVYDEFKSKYKERDKKFYEETVQELKDYSVHYSKLINPSLEPDRDISRELKYITRLEINVSFPFLLPVYNDYMNNVIDKTTFVKILKLIQTYAWRRFILGLPTSGLNKTFMSLYTDINININNNIDNNIEIAKEDYYPSIEKALVKKKGKQRFPNDKEIEFALGEKDVYNIQSKNIYYLLELLENYNNREPVSIDNPDISIEHIFPQNPEDKWYDELEESEINEIQDKYLNTLGNLTLSGNNGSLSNKTFLEKKTMNKDGKEQGYIYSRLWLNQYLKEIDEWNIDHIMNRYEMLLERFLNIWKYPDIDLSEENEADEDYNIFDAPDPRNKKLDYFIFKDEKIETNEVSKMYYHVIKTLFEENPSAFSNPEIKEAIGLSGNPEELRSAYKISSSYYVETNIDSNSKFRKLKYLLTKFDCEDDLLINYSYRTPGESEEEPEEINREYWEEKSSRESIKVLDECFKIINDAEPDTKLNYNKYYVGLSKISRHLNLARLYPKHSFLKAKVFVTDAELWIKKLESAGFKVHLSGRESDRFVFRINHQDIEPHRSLLRELFVEAYGYCEGRSLI